MTARIFAGDLRTGQIRVANIPVTQADATGVIGAAGSVGCTVKYPLVDPYTKHEVQLWNLVIPGRSFLAYEENGKILQAGPIWSREYDFTTNKITLAAGGLRSYYDRRFVVPQEAASDPRAYVSSFTGLSYRTIAKRLLQQAQDWTGGSLPIVFQEDDIPGDRERNYPALEMHRVNEKWSQLSDVEGGPDIALRPRRVAGAPGYIEWVFVTGDPELRQPGAAHRWDLTGVEPSVRGAKYKEDAGTLVTDDWEWGSTPEDSELPLFSYSNDDTLVDAGFPIFHGSNDRSSVTRPETLDEYAEEATFRGRTVRSTFAFDVKKNTSPRLGTYDEGDYAELQLKKGTPLPAGKRPLRLMSWSTKTGSDWVSLSCADERVRI